MTEHDVQPEHLDLPAYLSRIGYSGPLSPTRSVLEGLHLAHATRVPFENLDILLGRRIHLDLPRLQAKLVTAGRGGYCFEQNLLFRAAIECIGFDVTPLAARVRYRTDRTLARTHMMLRVEVGDTPYLADVGFGGEGLLLPVSMRFNRPVPQFAWTYRIVEEGPVQVLQSLHGDSWTDLYAFTGERQELADYQMANWYTSTHPDSKFVKMLIVQKSTPEARTFLHDRELIVDAGGDVSRRQLADDSEILSVLADRFGLRFPAGTIFPRPGRGAYRAPLYGPPGQR